MRDTVQDSRIADAMTHHYPLPTVLAAEVEEFHMGDGFAKKLAAKTGEFFH